MHRTRGGAIVPTDDRAGPDRPTRRGVLTGGALLGLGLLSGCNGIEFSFDPNDLATGTETETETPASGEATLKVVDSEQVVERVGRHTRGGTLTTVENAGDTTLRFVELTVDFRFETDALMHTGVAVTHGLNPGQQWQAYVPFPGDPDTIARHTVAGAYLSSSRPPTDTDAAELVTARFDRTPTAVGVVGEARALVDLPYLEARVAFVDQSGRVLSDTLETTTGLAPDDTWSFRADYVCDERRSPDVVADFTIELGTNWWPRI